MGHTHNTEACRGSLGMAVLLLLLTLLVLLLFFLIANPDIVTEWAGSDSRVTTSVVPVALS